MEKYGKQLGSAKKEIEKLNPRKNSISNRIDDLEDQLHCLQGKELGIKTTSNIGKRKDNRDRYIRDDKDEEEQQQEMA
ncbi:unnamed protein product [Allacma fusca]|uniref:Uncharacterized protein n=1 Tax=Allacma fusca TaxID=39272 RepID=A0A8J2P9D0_9HEXA|nr:unnamed protein product [Allacma fusca]